MLSYIFYSCNGFYSPHPLPKGNMIIYMNIQIWSLDHTLFQLLIIMFIY